MSTTTPSAPSVVPSSTTGPPPRVVGGRRRSRRLPPTARFILRRLAFVPVGVLIVVTICFVLVSLVPSDPAREITGSLASKADLAKINHQLGLDQPIPTRYVHYLGDLAHGDLGTSFFSHRAISDELRQHVGATIELIVLAIILAALYGMFAAVVSSYFAGRAPDRVARLVIGLTQAIPDFFLGIVLIYVFFFLLGVLPSPVGQIGIDVPAPPNVTGAAIVDSALAGQWSTFGSALSHVLLPVVTLAMMRSAYFAKTGRAVLLRTLNAPQSEFARSLGLSERKVIGYALKTTRTSMLTYGAIQFSALLGGAAIVELVFAWHGMGQWALEGILRTDLPAIQGFILVASLMTLLVFIALDIVVALLDPRISYE